MNCEFHRAMLAAIVVAFIAGGAAGGVTWTAEDGWKRSEDTGIVKGQAEFDGGWRYFEAGRYKKAEGLFDDVLDEGDADLEEDARMMRAECRLARKNYRGAFGDYEKVMKGWPNSRHVDRAMQGELEIARALLGGAKMKVLGLRIWAGYGLAEKIVDGLVSKRPFGDYAREGQIELARSYFKRLRYIESVSAYRQYLELYPNGAESEEAFLGVGKSYHKDARGPGYDPLPYYRARGVGRDFAGQYPGSAQKEAAGELARKAHAELAEHYFGIGKWYLKMGKKGPALLYLRKVEREYAGTEQARRAGTIIETLGVNEESDEGS